MDYCKEECKHRDICFAYKDNNEALMNTCSSVRTKNRKEEHIKDSTELSGGHMW